MTNVIVSDLHGDHSACEMLLREIGVIDPNGNREAGFHVVQVGDFIHAGHNEHERNLEMTKKSPWFDEWVIGNHEVIHLYPQHGFTTWHGVSPQLDRVTDFLRPRMVAALAVGDWLVTHAGLHPYLAIREGVPKNAVEAAAFLCERFKKRLEGRHKDPLFDWVGSRRGGREPVGGILWNDWRDMRAHEDFPVKQVMGHTPRVNHDGYESDPTGTLWCVDAGAALSGMASALVEDGEGSWTGVCVKRKAGRRGD